MKLLKLTLNLALAILATLLLSPWRARVLGACGMDIHWRK